MLGCTLLLNLGFSGAQELHLRAAQGCTALPNNPSCSADWVAQQTFCSFTLFAQSVLVYPVYVNLCAYPGLSYLQYFMGALDTRSAVSYISITPGSTLLILKNVKLLQVDWQRWSQTKCFSSSCSRALTSLPQGTLFRCALLLWALSMSCFKITWSWNNPTSEDSCSSAFV